MNLPLIPAPVELKLVDGEPCVTDGFSSMLTMSVDGEPDDGSYSLSVSGSSVVARAGESGAAAARATHDQLLELTGGSVPAMEITDAPRYRWRGLMLDISRHFFGPDTIRKVIDLAALYKLNVLHLHLTDDQGWRFEVRNRPELTETSKDTQVGGEGGGFLTAADLQALVEHAAERGIAVVGEIDLPGHTHAALHAVPGLNPDGVSPGAYTGTEVGHSTLRLELPETAGFLEDVVSALVAQTPGEFLHVGGDEVEHLSGEEYTAFIQHVEALVLRHGRRPVFWQEAAPALLDTRSVVQMWISTGDGAEVVAAARRGHDVILSPGNRTYLDMKHEPSDRLGLTWAGIIDVRDAYDWDPDTVLAGLPPDRILGVEAPLWTETIETEDDLFSMLLPRLAAFAEVAWSDPQVRDWEAFAEDLPAHTALWDARGLAWSRRPVLGH